MIVYVKSSSKKTRKQKAKMQAIRDKQRALRREDSFVRLERRVLAVTREGAMDFQKCGSITGRIQKEECPVMPIQHYTGTNIIGIATMHKSNMVPVFSQEEAVALAKMRR